MRRSSVILAVLLIVSASFASLPADAYKPGRMLIKFTPDFNVPQVTFDRGIAKLGIAELDALAEEFSVMSIEKVFPKDEKPDNPALVDLSRWYYFVFPEEIAVEDIIESYRDKIHIDLVEYDLIRYSDYTPNDPMLDNQWYIFNIVADSAWDVSRGSSNVVVAIVDSGIDTAHVDLQANRWINLGEDTNGDSIINLWDWNNFDDDGNGYIDDFYGWDFVKNDNSPHDADPSPEAGHGTHCAGDASADADNGNGIAGPGFSTAIMPIRCGEGGAIQHSLSGLYYARVSGADIVSMSYGNSQSWPPENDAIQACWQAGMILCGSAGNDNNTVWHYPSAYNNVIGVGASDQGDQKTYFSSYNSAGGGMYNVDVMAPGIEILSTQLGGGYVSSQGTSMATPIVAGMVGLIWNLRPDYTNAQIMQTIFDTVDDIYPQNPGFSYPQLGYGRVNAFNAVLTIAPYLRLESFDLTDSGNGDGRADPGETIELTFYISNDPRAQAAMDVNGVLTTDDEAVTITGGAQSFGNIIPGFSTLNNTPFSFEVGDTEPHWADFDLTMTTSEGVEVIIPIEIELGRPPVLLVADDDGDAVEIFYLNDFDDMGWFVDVWNQVDAEVSEDELNRYDLVVWATGGAAETLSSSEQEALEGFLDTPDKNLLFSSNQAGADLGGTAFYSDYLHASYSGIDGDVFVDGVESIPMTAGQTLFFIGGAASPNANPKEILEPVGGSEIVYNYRTSGSGAALRYQFTNGSKIVYTGFAIDAMNPDYLYSDSRVDMMSSIFDWFEFTSVEGPAERPLPAEFILDKNYPNPFNPKTMINFSVPNTAEVTVRVFNASGQEIATLVDGTMQAGKHHVLFDAENLASGIYVAVMQAEGMYLARKMVLVK